MNRLQSLCALLRLAVIGGFFIGLGLTVTAALGHDTLMIGIDHPQFDRLWREQEGLRSQLLVSIAPLALVVLLFCYWLQSLFGLYSKGAFFSPESIAACLWLVWLKFVGLIYLVLWPFVVALMPAFDAVGELDINLPLMDVLTALLLLVVVHVLRAAQAIDAENREFV